MFGSKSNGRTVLLFNGQQGKLANAIYKTGLIHCVVIWMRQGEGTEFLARRSAQVKTKFVCKVQAEQSFYDKVFSRNITE